MLAPRGNQMREHLLFRRSRPLHEVGAIGASLTCIPIGNMLLRRPRGGSQLVTRLELLPEFGTAQEYVDAQIQFMRELPGSVVAEVMVKCHAA